jgi:predicted outer membrane repeat protein
MVLPIAIVLVLASTDIDIPKTDWDAVIREELQLHAWTRSATRIVRFDALRPRYHAGVAYEVRGAEYKAAKPGVVIENGSSVTIAPGATFAMQRGAGIVSYGKLVVAGADGGEVKFRRDSATEPWANITFWGPGSAESSLRHCSIDGGEGRRTLGSDSGDFQLLDNGSPVGGGILLYDTSATLQDVIIANCNARYGGGIYLRNISRDPTDPNKLPPSCRFKNVKVKNCVARADSAPLAGGGAMMIKCSVPEFQDVEFTDNRAVGAHSCGGAVYVGEAARAAFINCAFQGNHADGFGGAIYARKASNGGDEAHSGVVISGTSRIEHNEAAGLGGGICAEDTRLMLVETKVCHNTVTFGNTFNKTFTSSGAGVYMTLSAMFGKNATQPHPISFIRCAFEDNKANAPETIDPPNVPDFVGGGMCIKNQGGGALSLQILECDFNGNVAQEGRHVALPSLFTAQGGWKHQRNRCTNPSDDAESHGIYSFANEGAPAPPQIDSTHPLPADCYGPRSSSAIINAVVLHFISAAEIPGAQRYDLPTILSIFTASAQNLSGQGKLSAHYLIDREGKIFRLVGEAQRAWHAGFSRMPGGAGQDEDVNDFSIGIEMIRTLEDAPSAGQYDSLIALLCDLKRRYPKIEMTRIVGHDAIRLLWNIAHKDHQVAPKQDPGPLFDWVYLVQRLNSAHFDSSR